MENFAHQAYVQLYGREPEHRMLVRYHAGFKGYNATVRKSAHTIEFSLSKKFETCEPEIKIGVMQLLLNRLNKTKIKTDEIDFYNNFLKHMSDLAPVNKSDEVLLASFTRVNEKYLDGRMTIPNLVWGNRNLRLLGTYTYATDTIMITETLREAPQEVLDSVMYHEMLHKKHKFSCSAGGRTHSHTKAFKLEEKLFRPADIEQRLHAWLRSAHRRKVTRTLFVDKEEEREERPGLLKRIMGWE